MDKMSTGALARETAIQYPGITDIEAAQRIKRPFRTVRRRLEEAAARGWLVSDNRRYYPPSGPTDYFLDLALADLATGPKPIPALARSIPVAPRIMLNALMALHHYQVVAISGPMVELIDLGRIPATPAQKLAKLWRPTSCA